MRRAWLALILVVFCGCFRNPVTGRKQLSLISQKQEIELGQESSAQVAQSLGLYPEPRVQEYVSTVGQRLAAASERPQLPWTFQVLDEAGVNAFALPGGPVFITRGLLTHLNSEAELVTVLGHEVGHIAARDSVALLSKAQLAQLGLGVGSIFVPDLAQLAGVGTSLLFLRFGRDAERRADELGFEYALAQGYDARAMADLFTTLDLASRSDGG
ncbi:MAG: M48 family metalloprotease, partial [Myxococcaceae bacterium]